MLLDHIKYKKSYFTFVNKAEYLDLTVNFYNNFIQ